VIRGGTGAISPLLPGEPQVKEGAAAGKRPIDVVRDGQGLLGLGDGGRVVPEHRVDDNQEVERREAHPGRDGVRVRQARLQPAADLGVVRAGDPVVVEGCDQTEHVGGVTALQHPAEGGPKVRRFGIQDRHPARLVPPRPKIRGRRGQERPTPRGVAGPSVLTLPRGLKPVQPELTDRLQHAIPPARGRPGSVRLEPEEAGVDEGPDRVDDVRKRGTNRLRRVQREAAGTDRQGAKEGLVWGLEEIV